ncbi:hypothetical protein C2S52_001837 [Perilla frutescens var. hirtella]|nr:hypothetical protein C2S52_001837 [Perilla frutescens var. hirtella]
MVILNCIKLAKEKGASSEWDVFSQLRTEADGVMLFTDEKSKRIAMEVCACAEQMSKSQLFV